MIRLCWVLGAALIATLVSGSASAKKDIVHDAEYYILKAQHGDTWATQDQAIEAKLKALQEKHGTPPNIVHIMWDDSPVGEMGIPHLQKNRGFATPNINQFTAEGAYFTRMVDAGTGRNVSLSKLLPYRGAWLEFETNPRDIVSVKIDRKRKLPVTTFLRALGYASDEVLLRLFGLASYLCQGLEQRHGALFEHFRDHRVFEERLYHRRLP